MDKNRYLYHIKDLIETRDIQSWINRRFNDPNFSLVPINVVDRIVTRDGYIYKMNKNLNLINVGKSYYRYNEIRKTDTVVDIGACIGTFIIPASKICSRAIAVEPVMFRELKENIKLNKANVKCINFALGDCKDIVVEWENKKIKKKTASLSEIINRCGGCDYLKLSCEGAEWQIKEKELEGIRVVEMQIHFKDKNELKKMIDMLENAGFNVEYEHKGKRAIFDTGMIHAKRLSIMLMAVLTQFSEVLELPVGLF